MTTHLHFLAHALRTPWAMEPGALAAYASILARAYAPKLAPGLQAEAPAALSAAAKVARSGSQRAGSIALIRVFGAIVQRGADLGPCEGGVGCEDISQALDMAMADETVSQVLMQFSTPGGSVFGVDELASKIRGTRGTKPIVGIADSMAASAGYYLASQCSELYCTPGGQVGSIGVYTAHEDVSKALEAAGVKVTLVSAGERKVEGNPFAPLDDDARAEIQAMVNRYYSAFVTAVAKGRNVSVETVRRDMGKGRMLGADAAMSAGMVDGVMSLEQLVKKMQGRRSTAAPTGPARQRQTATHFALQAQIEALR